MKKNLSVAICLLLVLSLFSACSKAPVVAGKEEDPQKQEEALTKPKVKPEMIAGKDLDEGGGADSYANVGDNPNSRYYVNPDFYNMKSDDTVTIIPNFKTMQQTAEWSCGVTTSVMVLNHFGKTEVTEEELSVAMGSHTDHDTPNAKPGSANNYFEYGTNLAGMYRYFSTLDGFEIVDTSYIENPTAAQLLTLEDGVTPSYVGNIKPPISSVSMYTSENDDNSVAWVEDAKDSYFVKWVTGHISAGRPIMVQWCDWNGHWQAIIGYDNNGTPAIGDDILIFADPYDTSDHWQDGYYYYPVERFFYMWKDTTIAPKPYQIQPYIVIDKK